MNSHFQAENDLKMLGFEITDIKNTKLAFTFFYFDNRTNAFDENGILWENNLMAKVPKYFEKISPVLWESSPISVA